jgi:hypothetical protein
VAGKANPGGGTALRLLVMRRTAEYARVFTRAQGRRDGPKEAKRKGDSKAAAEHADNADFTKEWANKGGCRWAS